jgi:putative DNA-invertase from lambdoid prophage Rac
MEIRDKIGYTRVSTRDQDPENQIRVLQASGIPPDYIFVDKGISGTISAEKRPGFVRAMQFAAEHKDEIKYLYVYEISRLGRSMYETIALIEKIERGGLMVWSLSPTEVFTQTSDKSIRQLLIAIMSWVAQRERENLIERTKAGLDRAVSEGKVLGKPRAIIDFERVRNMRIDGKNWEEIADEFKITVMTLYRARKRRGEI